jgi:hypothetical protein
MKILVKKDEVDSSRNVQGNPYIIKKQTDTTLMVRDGETIVISGLTRRRSSGGDSGIPWLKDVPGLGYLFKGENKSEKMEEVLIFITPHVLKQGTVSETGETKETKVESSTSKSSEPGPLKTKEKLSEDVEGGGYKYVVHVASLRKKGNMERLVKRLSDMGYSPTVTKIGTASNVRWFLVSLDGYQTRREATDVSASLERNIKGLKCAIARAR